MTFGPAELAMAFGAGLASVASPCVLPVVPLLVTGTAEDHRARPALVVAGLAASFVLMGVLTSLFGAAVGPLVPSLERAVALLVIAFGVLLLLDVNLFKGLSWLQRLGPATSGPWSGLVLGLSLGLVWIPCVGPMLSSVLAMVAARGTLASGVALLLVYSAGFAVPMLAVGYGSKALRQRIRLVAAHPVVVRWVSGLVLIGFGALVLAQGMLFAGR